jgi:glycosyltransferase involved in cell wall biosynthesis
VSRSLRVCFVVRDLQLGGAERQLVALASGLTARGHRVLILTYYAGGPLEAVAEAGGVDVRSLHKRGRWDLIAFTRRLAHAVRAFDADIVHGYMTTSNVLVVLARRWFGGARVIMGARGAARDWRQYDRGVRAARAVEMRLARRADLVIVNSHAGVEQFVVAGVERSRVAVVPNGIDLDQFRRSDAARAATRAAWGVGDELLIGAVGRIEPIKGFDRLLDAVAVVANQRADVRLVVVGGPRDPVYVDSLVARSKLPDLRGRVMWVGECADMPATYSACDLLASASSSEGTSNVILEAMACEVPCVVTDVGDSATIVADPAYVVPASDADALAAALLHAADDLDRHADLGARARDRVASRYGIETLTTTTIEIFEQLCAA